MPIDFTMKNINLRKFFGTQFSPTTIRLEVMKGNKFAGNASSVMLHYYTVQ